MASPASPFSRLQEGRYFAGLICLKIAHFLKIPDYNDIFYARGHGFLWRLGAGSERGESGAVSGPDLGGKG